MEAYGLDGMAAELERRWTHEDDEKRSSVRELETEFNTAVVRSVFVDIGTAPPEYSAEEVYGLLSGDGPAEDVAVVERWLEQHGYDPAAVADDFVSFQTIYNYLRDVRDAESPDTGATPEERREGAVEHLNNLRSRAERVSERIVQVIRRGGCVCRADGDADR